MPYLLHTEADTCLYPGARPTLSPADFLAAVGLWRTHLHALHQRSPVNLFEILGMRNLSAFVGEMYTASLLAVAGDKLLKNPHQDGSPDLLLRDAEGQALLDALKMDQRMEDKAPFSPFPGGGLEIKATCGAVPSPAQCRELGWARPGLGDTRLHLLQSYDWKAHHRETINLVGLVWDFHERLPEIVGIFFGNRLESADWSPVVQPKEGGGRTTSVSVLKRRGVRKMYENWLLVREDYLEFFDDYHGQTRMQDYRRR